MTGDIGECCACGLNGELVEEMGKVVEAADVLIDAASTDDQEEIVLRASDLRMAIYGYRITKKKFDYNEEGEDAVQ